MQQKGMASFIRVVDTVPFSRISCFKIVNACVLFLDLHLYIANGFVSSKIYDNAMTLILILIVNSPFFDGDVLRHASHGV